MNPYELIVLAAVVASLLTLFGLVAYQHYAERRDRINSAPSVQERLEALNRHRGGTE